MAAVAADAQVFGRFLPMTWPWACPTAFFFALSVIFPQSSANAIPPLALATAVLAKSV